MPGSLPGRSKTRPQDPEALSALSASKFPQLVPMKGERGGAGGGVSREEVGDSDRTQAIVGLGKVPGTSSHLPPPAKGRLKGHTSPRDTDSYRNGHLQDPSSCTNDPSALCFPPQHLGDEGEGWKGQEQLTWNAHLPGLCLQGPGWPQSPPATCPQLCDGRGHL